MTRATVLRWLERGLLATGAALGLWCAAVLVEARFFRELPPPPAAPVAVLPGDASTVNVVPRRAPVSHGTWLAKLEAPSVQLSATVLEGSDDDTLRRGAGHIEDTAFPGEAGNVGIAGHRDTIFRAVRRLQIGDPLDITTSDRVYHYTIARTTIVNPDDVYVLDPLDHPTLTLVTCYPFDFVGHAPKRFIVSADLIGHETR